MLFSLPVIDRLLAREKGLTLRLAPVLRGNVLLINSLRLVPLPVFLKVEKVGEGALSMPDAEVVGARIGEEAVLTEGGMRPSELLRMRGVEEERGTGS